MKHEEPPEDLFLVFCKGRCGNYTELPLSTAMRTIKKLGYDSLRDFCENFYCSTCDGVFAMTIESIETLPQQLTLNENSEVP